MVSFLYVIGGKFVVFLPMLFPLFLKFYLLSFGFGVGFGFCKGCVFTG